MFKRLKNHIDSFWRSLVTDYKVFAEAPQDIETMREGFRLSALPAFGYYFMLSVSTVISTLGLLANSSAAIIGGMIISPLMNPIVTLAFGITVKDRRLIDRGFAMLLTGIPLVIVVAYVVSSIVNIRVIGSEVLSRTHPSYLDLGVALAAGVAAAFSYSRKSIINALPGVAIAVALVPPLCVVGIGLHAGHLGELMASNAGIDENMAIGAASLFFTNLWGIICAAIVVFLTQGYGTYKKAAFGFLASVVMLFIVTVPLESSFYKMYIRELFYHELLALRAQDLRFSDAEVQKVDIRLLRGTYRIHMTLFSNVDRLKSIEETQKRVDRVAAKLSKRLGHPVRVEMNIIPLYHLRSQETAPVS